MRNYTYLAMVNNGRLIRDPEGNILLMSSMAKNESSPMLPMLAIEFMVLLLLEWLLGIAVDNGIVRHYQIWSFVIGAGIGVAFYFTMKEVLCFNAEHASCRFAVFSSKKELAAAKERTMSLLRAMGIVTVLLWFIVIALVLLGNITDSSVRNGLSIMWFATTFMTLYLEPRQRLSASNSNIVAKSVFILMTIAEEVPIDCVCVKR